MRLTEGSIPRVIIRFAMPLFLGNVFQQLYNAADAFIVGNLLGDTALAAVASSGSLLFLMIGMFNGLFMGAGVVTARFFGQEDTRRLRLSVHSTVLASLIFGAAIMVIGTLATPAILRAMGTPANVMPQTAQYVRIYFLGGVGLTVYNACMGIMQAVGDSRHPLMYLIFSSVLNVILDVVFIRFFGMGVDGAALATIIAQFLSAGLCILRLMRTRESHRLVLRELKLDWICFKMFLRYGLPSALQNSVIAFANIVVQSNINSFGEFAMAGCGAYSKLEGFAFIPIVSFSAAMTTFVGQNLGAGEYGRAEKGARFGVLCATAIAEVIGVTSFLLAPQLIGLFADDAAAIGFGVNKMRICSLFFCIIAMTHVMSGVLRGAGRAIVPTVVLLSVWCVFRVAFLAVMVPIVGTIDIVNWVYPITWFMSAVILVIYFLKSDWLHAFDKVSAAECGGIG